VVTETQAQRGAAASGRRWASGSTIGNEELTAMTAIVLLVLLAALGITILRVRQLLNPHMFIGMMLLGPVLLKMLSTGWRFIRYYSGSAPYVSKGPPPFILRASAPIVVLSTVAVFATGIVLLVAGPSARSPFLGLHKASFIVWLAFMALHVLGHLPELPHSLRASSHERATPWDDYGAGRGARALALTGSLVAGVILAILTIPLFASWAHLHILSH
jgi:hypothetical protein